MKCPSLHILLQFQRETVPFDTHKPYYITHILVIPMGIAAFLHYKTYESTKRRRVRNSAPGTSEKSRSLRERRFDFTKCPYLNRLRASSHNIQVSAPSSCSELLLATHSQPVWILFTSQLPFWSHLFTRCDTRR